MEHPSVLKHTPQVGCKMDSQFMHLICHAAQITVLVILGTYIRLTG